MPIGRVEGCQLDVAAVNAWADEQGIAVLYFLARTDPRIAATAEEAGFRLVDVRVELSRSSADAAGAVRLARPDDGPALRQIARTNHRTTRFYADPRFPDARCDDLYETWIVRSLEGWADAVLVADADARPAGYASVHAVDDAGRGSIDLMGVAPEARGRGLGRELTLGAVAWCCERGLHEVTLVTQARNVPAMRLFEQCGFRIADVALWFHKSYER